MRKIEESTGPWTIRAVAAAVSTSVTCYVAAIVLNLSGSWPPIPGSEAIAASLAGGVVLFRFHRNHWYLIPIFFVPVMVILLTIGALVTSMLLGHRFEP